MAARVSDSEQPHVGVTRGDGDDGDGECIVCAATAVEGPLWRCPVRETHVCCHDCINQFAQARVDDGMSMVPCPCDFSDCAHQISDDSLKEILSGDAAERYTQLKLMHSSPNAVQCPTCSKPTVGNPRRPDIVCDSCSTLFCFHHGLDHAERSCRVKKAKSIERLRNWRWRACNTRKCKKCAFRIQKSGGCNHMTCRCGHEICWRCGGDYNRCVAFVCACLCRCLGMCMLDDCDINPALLMWVRGHWCVCIGACASVRILSGVSGVWCRLLIWCIRLLLQAWATRTF